MATYEQWWLDLWEERRLAICDLMSSPLPPDTVVAFDDTRLPGACGLKFNKQASRPYFAFVSMGLSQPFSPDQTPTPYEFVVYTQDDGEWPYEVLHDLLCFAFSEPHMISPGLFLPSCFFLDRGEQLHFGLAEPTSGLRVIGELRGLYLWPDQSVGSAVAGRYEFSLLVPILITADEDMLGQRLTPPHTLLLLNQEGVSQVADPMRKSVLRDTEVVAQIPALAAMRHDEAIARLAQSRAKRATDGENGQNLR